MVSSLHISVHEDYVVPNLKYKGISGEKWNDGVLGLFLHIV